jgi:hypothetical protein
MNRRIVSWAFPLGAVGVILLLIWLTRDHEEQDWSAMARVGCQTGAFGRPSDLLPPELRQLRGPLAAADNARLWNSVQVSLNEFARAAFREAKVNLNCSAGSYDGNDLNVYFVTDDRDGSFEFANGMIITRTDAKRVIVFGQRFWDFFSKGWRPVLEWKMETTDPRFLSALGDLYIEAYEFYLEWAIAHELGHIRLNHHAASSWFTSHDQQDVELDADIEAARTLRSEYLQATPHLLGLVKETMKYYFAQTYRRPWTANDGEAFESNGIASFRETTWSIKLPTCLHPTHPPFLLRSLAMLDAASVVAREQAAQINEQARKNEAQALSEENSVESELALEQLKEAQDRPSGDATQSLWPEAVADLVKQLRRRIQLVRSWHTSCAE